MSRLYIASDHRGFADKQRIIAELSKSNVSQKYEIIDLGPATLKPDDDYNDAAIAVARAVRVTPGSRGILICGSAHGVSIQANRFKGIRAIVGYDTELVHVGRMHNDANVLCLSADFMKAAAQDAAISMFLSAEFLPEERYIRRNNRLDEELTYD